MQVAVFSDSHDNLDALRTAIGKCKDRGLTQAIHLGDYCAPFVMDVLGESSLQWVGVWGNNDGDRVRSLQTAGRYEGRIDIAADDFREHEVGGRRIFLTHYPQIGRIAALSGQYEAVFHGHTHLAAQEIVEVQEKRVLLANPGEIYGKRFGKPSFGVYDSENHTFEHVWL